MSLDDVINAVADKVDVDWAAAEADLRGTPHAQRLHDLKMLAHLQQLHHSGGAPTVEKLQSVGGRGDVADPHTVRFTSEATNGSPDVRPDSVRLQVAPFRRQGVVLPQQTGGTSGDTGEVHFGNLSA